MKPRSPRTQSHTTRLFGDRMAECAVSWTEDLKVGSSIPTVARGYLIFPAQNDECHQEQLHSPGVDALKNVWLHVKMGYSSKGRG